MTALQLLAYLSAALLFQIAAGVVVVIWRKRAEVVPTPQFDEQDGQASSTGAWAGWRDFRVIRRNFEDAVKSQCSFYLQPVDARYWPGLKSGSSAVAGNEHAASSRLAGTPKNAPFMSVQLRFLG